MSAISDIIKRRRTNISEKKETGSQNSGGFFSNLSTVWTVAIVVVVIIAVCAMIYFFFIKAETAKSTSILEEMKMQEGCSDPDSDYMQSFKNYESNYDDSEEF